jgi:hypothetical protein
MPRGNPIATGSIFGKLTARSCRTVRVASRSRTYTYQVWLCDCNCGNQTETRTGRLLRGETRSCGCLVTEALAKSNDQRSASSLAELIRHQETNNMYPYTLPLGEKTDRSGYLSYVSRQLQMLSPNEQHWDIRSVKHLKERYPGLRARSLSSLENLESLLREIEEGGMPTKASWLKLPEPPPKPQKDRKKHRNSNSLLSKEAIRSMSSTGTPVSKIAEVANTSRAWIYLVLAEKKGADSGN